MTTGDLSINENKKKVQMVLSFIPLTPKTFITNQIGFTESITTSFCKFISNGIFRLQHKQIHPRFNNMASFLIWLAILEK